MLEFLEQLAKTAGEESLRYFGNIRNQDIDSKVTSKDLVSIADKAVEALIIREITKKFPDHDIFGEETGHAGKNSEFCWIIDPIDGTQSFVKYHPYYSISIAIYKNGRPYAGAVNAPALGRLFTALAGQGAYMNGSAIHVSGCAMLEEAACATGFARLRENKVFHQAPDSPSPFVVLHHRSERQSDRGNGTFSTTQELPDQGVQHDQLPEKYAL